MFDALSNGEIACIVTSLQNNSNSIAPLASRESTDSWIGIKDLYIPAIATSKTFEDLNSGRLSGTIWSQECKYLALLNAEIDSIDRSQLSIEFLEAFDRYHMLHKCHCATLGAKVRENRI
jgi:hypothetical protein